jgi:GNAT superfamily N-acetyltransferase
MFDTLWCRILDAGHAMDAWLAVDGEKYVGLAHTIRHPHTFTLRPVCYLEDLWVSPAARNRGVATNMIAHLSEVGKKEGWRRLYWKRRVTTMWQGGSTKGLRRYDRLRSTRSR